MADKTAVQKLQRRLLLALAASLFSTVQAGAQTTSSQAPSPPKDTAAIEAIDADFEHFAQTAHIPGLVWGFVQNGKLVHVGTVGVQDVVSNQPVTADSVFRIASMSKAFTGLAILKLRDDAKLSLDDPLTRYIPEAGEWHYPT